MSASILASINGAGFVPLISVLGLCIFLALTNRDKGSNNR